jgi:hypothetical protein
VEERQSSEARDLLRARKVRGLKKGERRGRGHIQHTNGCRRLRSRRRGRDRFKGHKELERDIAEGEVVASIQRN